MLDIFEDLIAKKPIIGMVHLGPLPGSPRYAGDLASLVERALADAETLVEGGCHALMMENFGDVPFFPGAVPGAVIAVMTRIAAEINRRCAVPLGINVLRNDGVAALAVAAAADASFIRVNVLTGARVTDQGLIQGIAHDLMRERAALRASHIRVLADVDVKHSAPLAARSLADEVQDTWKRGLADALIVSGAGTGAATDPAKLQQVKAAAGDRPVLVGSGVTPETLAELARHADGFIVGTVLKEEGDPTRPVEPGRVRRLFEAWRRL